MRAHTITNLTRPAWRRLVLLVLGVCALALPATAGAAQQSTSAEAVRDWNLYAANADMVERARDFTSQAHAIRGILTQLQPRSRTESSSPIH
jgi:hypothetical protein